MFWGCIFSSSWLAKTASIEFTPAFVRKIPAALFSLVFPDECRVCELPLHEVSRIPVCRACLAKPEPLQADYFCVQCKAPFLNAFPLDEHGVCALCRRGVMGFDAAYSFGFYEGGMRDLIHVFKYGRVQTLAEPLGRFLARALPLDLSFDVIVPMPLHWRKRWQRGFNQSGLLSQHLARRRQLPVVNALRRVRFTAVQAGLTSSKRRLNVSGAFRARKRLDGKRVLLVDDVMTTGATASACARVLKMAGAREVTLLTLARADRRIAPDQQKSDSNFSGRSEDAQSRSIA